MIGLVVVYNVVASVIGFDYLQRRSKHICRYFGCSLYFVVYIMASALTMDGFGTQTLVWFHVFTLLTIVMLIL